MNKYYLIGEKLGHSYSKEIHEQFGYKYNLLELKRCELGEFLKKKDFDGLNVTIPYKEEVIKYLDEVDCDALKIGAVNTVVNRDNKLYGYNTDYLGFIECLKNNKVALNDKICLVLGDGGASKSVVFALEKEGAKKIYIATRKKEKYNSDIYKDYQEIKDLDDVNIIINTTSVGMWPNINDCLDIDFDNYKKCVCFIDIIYNPIVTTLGFLAKEKGLIYINGMEMLINQAKQAARLFTNKAIYNDVMLDHSNIVLIGMSGCGKTTYGKQLAESQNKKFIDTDELIKERMQLSVREIFDQYGEEYFRHIESEVINEVSLLNDVVISTGGGVILNRDNMINLKHNGKIIFIKKDVNEIIKNIEFDGSRPLLKNEEDIRRIYQERLNLYLKYSDEVLR